MSRLSISFFLPSENVTVNDIKRVSNRMLASKPSVAALGNLANLPKFEEVERAFGNRGNFSGASRFFLFRNWWHQQRPVTVSTRHFIKSSNHVSTRIFMQWCTTVSAAVLWSLVVWTLIKTSAKQNLTFDFLWRVFAKFSLQLVIWTVFKPSSKQWRELSMKYEF